MALSGPNRLRVLNDRLADLFEQVSIPNGACRLLTAAQFLQSDGVHIGENRTRGFEQETQFSRSDPQSMEIFRIGGFELLFGLLKIPSSIADDAP